MRTQLVTTALMAAMLIIQLESRSDQLVAYLRWAGGNVF
jgi:hypothetical protein